MKKLLIFDYDGVIVDSLQIYMAIHNNLAKQFNLPLLKNREELGHMMEKNFYDTPAGYGLTPPQMQDFLHEIKEQIMINQEKITIVTGMPELLAEIATQNTCVIVTSGHTESVTKFLTHHNLIHHFQYVLGADHDPSKVKKIKKSLIDFATEKERAYFISDTMGDIEEGKQVGVTTIAVSWGYHTKEKLAEGRPDFSFNTVKDFETFLLHL